MTRRQLRREYDKAYSRRRYCRREQRRVARLNLELMKLASPLRASGPSPNTETQKSA